MAKGAVMVTPADIRYHISLALARDEETRHPNDPPLPARFGRIINEAITKACDEADAKEKS